MARALGACATLAAEERKAQAEKSAQDDEGGDAEDARDEHELAAIANSESNCYQVGTGAPAYMEEALGKLGFTGVSTASYRYRSEIVDEVVNFLTNTNDVAAYSIGA